AIQTQASVEGRSYISGSLELLPDPTLLKRLFVLSRLETIVELAGGKCIKNGIRGKHSALHRVMSALDLGRIKETRTATNQTATRKSELRNRLQTSFVERPCAVRDSFAVFKVFAHRRV